MATAQVSPSEEMQTMHPKDCSMPMVELYDEQAEDGRVEDEDGRVPLEPEKVRILAF